MSTALDPETVHNQLESVVSAMNPVDAFYVALVSVDRRLVASVADVGHFNNVNMGVDGHPDELPFNVYGSSDIRDLWHFDVALQQGYSWLGYAGYGPDGTPDLLGGGAREQIIPLLFSPFEPENTLPNCIEPLGELSALEKEIKAADGTATDFQRQMILTTLHALHGWLMAQQRSMEDGFQLLSGYAGTISGIHNMFQADNAFYAERIRSDGGPGSFARDLQSFVSFQQKIIERAETVQVPAFELGEAWNTLIGMVQDVADHVGDAELAGVSSVFQRLDIEFSLKIWPVLCDIATKLRSEFALPPRPAAVA